MDTDRGQRWLASEVASRLGEKIGSRVEIDAATLGLPGHVKLNGVRLFDRADTLMLQAATLEGTVSLSELLGSGAIRLNSISLLDGDIILYKENDDAPLNVQFLLDAFKSKEEMAKALDFQISGVVMRRFTFRYDCFDRPRPLPGRLSPDHIDVRNLSLVASLPALNDSLLHLQLRELSFVERSGLHVEGLRTELWGYKGGLKFRDFDLKMPATHIVQHELVLAFSNSDPIGTLHTSGVLADAQISTDDFAPVLPLLKPLHSRVSISSSFDITPKRIVLRDADFVVDRPSIAFRGDVQLDRDGKSINFLMVRSDRMAAEMVSLSSVLQTLGFGALPDVVQRFGGMDFQGDLTWKHSAETLFNGTLSTAQGSIRGHAIYKGKTVQGDVYFDNIKLATLLGDNSLPNPLTASVNGVLTLQEGEPQSFDGKLSLIQTLYRDRSIAGVTAEGHADRSHIDLRLDSRDPSAILYGQLTANLHGAELQNLHWQGEVIHFAPAVWGIKSPKDLALSLDGVVEVTSLFSLSHIDGNAHLNNLQVKGGGLNFSQRDISLSLHPSTEGHDARVESAYGTFLLRGPFNPERMITAAKSLLYRAAPDFAPMILGDNGVPSEPADSASWYFQADIVDDALFPELFHLPLAAPYGIKAEGTLAESDGRTDIMLRADTLCYDGQGFSAVRVYIQGEGEEYSLMLQTHKTLGGMAMDLAATAQTAGNELTTRMSWQDRQGVFRGELDSHTKPYSSRRGTMITELHPTEVFFKDSVWNVVGGTVLWGGDTLAVNRFLVEHDAQHIAVDGSFSAGSPDSITADLHSVNLEYVFDLLKFHPVYFAGIADGHAVLTFADKRPVVNALLDVHNFSINEGLLGRARIKGEVDLSSLLVHIDADMLEVPHGRTFVLGTVSPKETALDLAIESRGTNLRFLRPYINGILSDVSGRATGRTRLYGTFKELQLGGDVMAQLTGYLPVTGCHYSVDSAHVVMTPGVIDIPTAQVRDTRQGTAQAQGRVRHNHLSNFRYNFDFQLDHCLIYDRSRTSDLTFASHALATGTVGIKGEPGRLDCDINVRPNEGSNFFYHVDLPDDYTGSTLLNIRPALEYAPLAKSLADAEEKVAAQSASDVYMNMHLDMQPDVPLTVIMDEKTGDNILVRGSGPLRASYHNKGQFQLFGTYTVADGIYKMTVQDIIHKDFRFQPGGTVRFNGKPFDGQMDMQAVYTVPSASLADLNLTGGVSQNGIRVNCLLNFSGRLEEPHVRFDLDMPTVNQDVKQMVRSLISTDEEMNRQVLYLLAIGRFYTYDYANTAASTTQSQSETAMNSFLSNTLSGQLNNFIASAMGQSNWTIGTNLSTGNYGWEDVGVEGQIGGRLLSGRLLINGNIGYRNSVTQPTGNFIGDFDVQYLLTPGGGIRLKAYNETNDRYFTRNSLTTQGVGIVFQRSFNRPSQLFTRKSSHNKF